MTFIGCFARGSAPLFAIALRTPGVTGDHTHGGMATSAGRAVILWVPKNPELVFCGTRAAGLGVRQHGVRRAAARLSTASKSAAAVTQQTRGLSLSGLVPRVNCGTRPPRRFGVSSGIDRRGVRCLTSGVVSCY